MPDITGLSFTQEREVHHEFRMPSRCRIVLFRFSADGPKGFWYMEFFDTNEDTIGDMKKLSRELDISKNMALRHVRDFWHKDLLDITYALQKTPAPKKKKKVKQ